MWESLAAPRSIVALLLLSMAGCELPSEATVFEPVAPAVSATRLQVLDKGLVATDWIERTYVPNLYTAADLSMLKAAGIRNVRVPFGMGAYADATARLFQEDTPDTPNPAALANYNEILDEILGQGLGVVVTPADSDNRTWRSGDVYQGKLVRFWRALGKELARRDLERVFIKVGYDPTAGNPDDWYAIQRELFAALREDNGDRTLLATPNAFTRQNVRDPMKELQEMPPEADPNVVYDVGFFTPTTFTLQGANWRDDEPWLAVLHGLPYPSSPAACAPALANITDAAARRAADSYCTYPYNQGTLAQLFKGVAEWAESHHVTVSNSGFAVYKSAASYKPQLDDASRVSWIADVRGGFEAESIPWAFYNDLPDFTGLTGDAGARAFEPGVLNALFRP